MRDRYYIIETRGWGIANRTGTTSPPPASSFSILDRAFVHREVRQFYARSGQTDAQRRELAEAECDHMNADERAWYRAVA